MKLYTVHYVYSKTSTSLLDLINKVTSQRPSINNCLGTAELAYQSGCRLQIYRVFMQPGPRGGLHWLEAAIGMLNTYALK